MSSSRHIFRSLLAVALGAALPAQEALERLGEKLNFAFADGTLQLRLSGSLELEGYVIPEPVADLVSGEAEAFIRPRFSLYLDAQLGERAYLFAQGRADRGFDVYAAAARTEARLDECALRIELGTPGSGRLSVQAGKFATVVGNWTRRHTAWENPFITAPLPYNGLTAVWDVAAVPTPNVLLAWAHVRPVGNSSSVLSDKHLRLPLIWGPAYGQGVALAGRWGRFDYAGEVKATGLSARPERWDQGFGGVERPTFSGRLGFRPGPAWSLGLSASRGEYLDRSAHGKLPAGYNRHDYTQTLLAHDLSYARRHFQLWAEVQAARFEAPRIGSLDTLAWYAEAKYRFTPAFSTALRWGQQWFDRVRDSTGAAHRWGRQTWRLEFAPAWRFTTQTQLKLQYGLQGEKPAREKVTQALAAQINVRF